MSPSSSSTESSAFEERIPFNRRFHVPIRPLSKFTTNTSYERQPLNQINSKDTTLQWIDDPITGGEKFRIRINIEGFRPNEVHTRIDGNKLHLYGEHIENKSQGTSKIILDKCYPLPLDIDILSSRVTFPTSTMMQVDYSPKFMPVRFNQTRRYVPSQSSLHDNKYIQTLYNGIPLETRPHIRGNAHRIPIVQIIKSVTDTVIPQGATESSKHRLSEFVNDFSSDQSVTTHQQSRTENYQQSNLTAGVPVNLEREYQRSIKHSSNMNNLHTNTASISSSSSSSLDINKDTVNSNSSVSLFFPLGFDSETFYRSEFQPVVITDDHNQRFIKMKINMKDYDPDHIRVAVNDNDLIVQVQRTSFYQKITLPPNIDLSSLSLNYNNDDQLCISIKLLDEHSSFKYI